MLFYDICLLITKDGSENFGIAKLQTDNIFIIRMEAFMKKEEKEIIKAKFKAKNQTMLGTDVSKDYNSYCKTIGFKLIIIEQKNSAEKLVLIDVKNNTIK